ncbi:MAG: tRNA 2-thiouridine(34) synthase MnmA [Actinomycetota bacterium]
MERVVVGMSGGVDSSVAAAVLLEQGYEVVGATMLVWSPPGVDMNFTDSCCGLSAAEDARRVCARLGIRHYTLDFKDVFYERIIRNYVEEYSRGRTPNPCVLCNEWIKFRALLDRAQTLGAERVATGHYARVRYHEERRRWLLLRGLDARKDQSYALYRLSQEQLSRTLFPLGELEKPRVRELAAELSLPTAGKPDSQETCFVPNNDYPALLQILAPESFKPGEIRSTDGRVLGRHEGVAYYTIGQRKRLNVGSPVPLYVTGLDPESSAVTVGPVEDEALFRQEVVATDVNLVGIEPPDGPLPGPIAVTARIRYNSGGQPATLTFEHGEDGLRMRARFEAPVRAVTPGQSLVCYQGDELLGGGIIAG